MFDNAKLYCSERRIPGYLKKRIKNFYLSFTDGFYESKIFIIIYMDIYIYDLIIFSEHY